MSKVIPSLRFGTNSGDVVLEPTHLTPALVSCAVQRGEKMVKEGNLRDFRDNPKISR